MVDSEPSSDCDRLQDNDLRPIGDRLPDAVRIRVGDIGSLLDRAGYVSEPTELVVAPVELHRRNIQRRLRERGQSMDPFTFAGASVIASRVLEASDSRPDTVDAEQGHLDRIDRMSRIEHVLSDNPETAALFDALPGVGPDRAERIERVRAEIETVTNYNPVRIAAYRETAADLRSPIDADSIALLDGVLQIESSLLCRSISASPEGSTTDSEGSTTDPSEMSITPPSEGSIVRSATRCLMDTDGRAWNDAYPRVERLSVVGLDTVSAVQIDLITALVETTSIEVVLYLRRGTGRYLTERIPELIGVSNPGMEVFA